jgi:hypothetical protein
MTSRLFYRLLVCHGYCQSCRYQWIFTHCFATSEPIKMKYTYSFSLGFSDIFGIYGHPLTALICLIPMRYAAVLSHIFRRYWRCSCCLTCQRTAAYLTVLGRIKAVNERHYIPKLSENSKEHQNVHFIIISPLVTKLWVNM